MAAIPDTTELTRGKTKQAQLGRERTRRRGHPCKSSPCTTWAGDEVCLSEAARSQFARTFADVLSGRFGGRWVVEWKGADRAALPSARNRGAVADKK